MEENRLRLDSCPEKIRSLLADRAYTADDIGMSEASVLLFEDMVLKVQEDSEEAENECRMLWYLQNRLPVPEVLAYEKLEGKSYLLMSRCRGQAACSEEYMKEPAMQCRLLASGLKKLWDTDITGCPSDQSLSKKLSQARYNIDHNLVDYDNVDPATFGEGGFKDAEELWQWLCRNAPEEEITLSHGDYCLPNLFGIGERVTGYIDLGRAGIADRWCDIAICYRSISHNYSGRYHQKIYPGYDKMPLFRELGIEPDWKKIQYYILLDELF